MPGTDDFSTSIPLEVLPRLISLGQRYGFDPLSSIEMETYFTRQLARNTLDHIEMEIIPNDFISIGDKPHWLQGSEWPESNGRPMVFLGQFDVSPNRFIPGETAIYIFCDRVSGKIQTVVQRVGYVP